MVFLFCGVLFSCWIYRKWFCLTKDGNAKYFFYFSFFLFFFSVPKVSG